MATGTSPPSPTRAPGVGKAGDKAMEIYINSQSWAIIGQCTTPERAASCLEAADAKLSSKWGPLTINPPYLSYDPNVGRLSVLRPGCGENGTVYVHAAVFYALANFMARRPDHALEVFEQICPLLEGHTPRSRTPRPMLLSTPMSARAIPPTKAAPPRIGIRPPATGRSSSYGLICSGYGPSTRACGWIRCCPPPGKGPACGAVGAGRTMRLSFASPPG